MAHNPHQGRDLMTLGDRLAKEDTATDLVEVEGGDGPTDPPPETLRNPWGDGAELFYLPNGADGDQSHPII